MTFYQMAQRLLGLWKYFVIVVVVLGVVIGVFGDDLLRRLSKPCAALPEYHDDVAAEVRAQLAALHEHGLLYCSDPVSGLATMHDRVYWGSDGVSSVLFFQADSLEGIGVTRYGFGQSVQAAYVPMAPGASPVPGARQDVAGRPAITNQAPEGATWFYSLQGAPEPQDSAVAITLRGPARAQPGVGGRDAFRDIEIIWDVLRGRPRAELSDTSVVIGIPILPDSLTAATRRAVAPTLVEDDGLPSVRRINEAPPDAPTFLQVVSGPLGTSVWAAGVISETNPALVLVPEGGSPLEPFASSGWDMQASDQYLQHFAFEPQPSGTYFEARYWNDARHQGDAPPDYRWPVTIP